MIDDKSSPEKLHPEPIVEVARFGRDARGALFRRREFLRVFGLGLAASALLPQGAFAASSGFPDSINPAFKLDGVKLTPEDSVTSYNNFYEWGFAQR